MEKVTKEQFEILLEIASEHKQNYKYTFGVISEICFEKKSIIPHYV